MKTKQKFVDEISGREFNTLNAAVRSERRSRDIKKTFAFYKAPKDPGYKFSDGVCCKRRTKTFYNKLVDGLFRMINKYEKWIVQSYKRDKIVFRKVHIDTYYITRCLGDGNSPLYEWSDIIHNICTTCYREHGQGYHKVHCRHNMKEKSK